MPTVETARVAAILLLGACTFAGCSGREVADGPEGPPEMVASSGVTKARRDEVPDRRSKYGYVDPDDDDVYANVFKIGGRLFSIILVGESENGVYTRDKVGVYEVTEGNDGGWRYDPAQPVRRHKTMDGTVFVDVEPSRDDAVVRMHHAGEAVEVSVADLYRWRASSAVEDVQIGEQRMKRLHQMGMTHAYAYFPVNVTTLVLDPEIALARLAPKYVVHYLDTKGLIARELPIGDTGYVLRYDEAENLFNVERATGKAPR